MIKKIIQLGYYATIFADIVYVNIIKPAKEIIAATLYDRTGYVSRKLVAAWILTLLTTVLVTGHIIAWHLLELDVPQLLASPDYVAFLSVIWGSYFATNVIGSSVDKIYRRKTEDHESGPDNEIPGH